MQKIYSEYCMNSQTHAQTRGVFGMALKDTIKKMHKLLEELAKDLIKGEKGNKAAAQRVRTGSIKMEKVAKKYRKESITAEKKGLMKKKPAKKVAKKKPAKKVAKKIVKKKPVKKVAKNKPVKKVAKKKVKKTKKR